jgi:predicted metal-binding membrane protein
MRYQCEVTDIPHETSFTHLSGPATQVAAVLARPRRLAVACVIALTALGWGALGLMGANADIWTALCQPMGAGGAAELALVLSMWAAMTFAMMLPTAGPMVLTYAEIADTAARKQEPAASPLVLAAGYISVWLGFAVVATALQFALTQLALLDGGRPSPWLAGVILLGAGLYQFSTLKHTCLTICQRPFPFFFANWTTEPLGVFKLGMRQGRYCLGCCWAMMLVMFAAGVMSVVWMAALGVVMTIEKMTTTTRFTHIVGGVFVTIGLGIIAMTLVK